MGTDRDWAQIRTSGAGHTCGLRTDGSLWCWGEGAYGKLGLGDTDDRYVPTQVGTDHDWALVVPGGFNTCALRVDRSLWCCSGLTPLTC